jgi:hypothetical protein
MVLTYTDNSTLAVGPGNPNGTPSKQLDLCVNFIGLRCNFRQNQNASSEVSKLGCCEIYDDAPDYKIFTKIASFTYSLYDASVTKVWESTELGCYNEVFTVTYVTGGVTIT